VAPVEEMTYDIAFTPYKFAAQVGAKMKKGNMPSTAEDS
jgi:hypothetical protein